MKNLLNYGIDLNPIPISGIIGLGGNEPAVSMDDGSEWVIFMNKPVPYDIKFNKLLQLRPELFTTGSVMNTFYNNNSWNNFTTKQVVGALNGVWLLISSAATNYYYLSTNKGVTWTIYTLPWPLAGRTYRALWDGTRFIMYAQSQTSSAVIESVDGISWGQSTGVSIALNELLLLNGVYIAWSAGNSFATSLDRVTWTNITGGFASPTLPNRQGNLVYHPPSGLYVTGTNTPAQYMTSPSLGVSSWTFRQPAEFLASINMITTGCPVVTNGNIILYFGSGGIYGYSYDAVTWVLGNVAGSEILYNTVPIGAYFDGTLFIVNYGSYGLFYSLTGLPNSWAFKKNLIPGSGILRCSDKTMSLNNTTCLFFEDLASEAVTYFCPQSGSAVGSISFQSNYMRIS
jgi:hypothetical protein